MSEGRRRPPPGKSFPFLRRGHGLKAKIDYPVLKGKATTSKPDAGHPGPSNRYENDDESARLVCNEEEHHSDHQRLDGVTELDWRTPSIPRTVRTADSGFHQEVENRTNAEEPREPSFPETPSVSSSASREDSPGSSSVAPENVDLRKRGALPLQKWTKEKNYSFSAPTAVTPSPMLASTPRQDSEWGTSRPVESAPALETSILGDVTNVGSSAEKTQAGDAALPSHVKEGAPTKGRPAPTTAVHDIWRSDQVPTGVNPPVAQRPGRGFSSSQQDGTHHGNVYTEVERKLVEQLRNAIAHLDLAEAEQRMRAEDLEKAYAKFLGDVQEFEAEKETEKERVLRVRRQLERERKIANKDGEERDKAVAEQVEELMKTIAQKDRQISTLRLRQRKLEEQVESKEKELSDSAKKVERLEKSAKILQRQLAQLRGSYAKQSQEVAAELQAARSHNIRRKGTVGLLPTLHQARHEVSTTGSTVEVQEPQRASQERLKCVSWADKSVPVSSSTEQPIPKKGTYQMELVEEGVAYFGPCRLFKNGIGEWTKVTTTDCGCDLYEYSNSDVRWLSCDRTVEINYFGVVGATVITLQNGCCIRYFNTGQIELYRLSGEISRFDGASKQRSETMLHPDRSRYVEIFDSTGSCLRLDRLTRSWIRVGERSSYRGHPSDRHVYNHSNVEPEWIEPEYNARRCPDGSLKVKFANIMVCCLGVEDVGYVKHTTRLENGGERKRMCVEWGHVARARQRQIESRKCQQMTALNSTM